jgi:hypothetical protein
MKLAVLSVILLTALVELASSVATVRESANSAAAVQTVLSVLGEIPLSKLLEIFH